MACGVTPDQDKELTIRMKKKDLMVIAIGLFAAALLCGAAAWLMPRRQADVSGSAIGYVYIQAGNEGRWYELPQTQQELTVRRTLADGSQAVNTIVITPEGVHMAASTCLNQDCVEQGEVTLSNKADRVLRNLIVCLPNEVSIELYAAEEIERMQDAAQ